MEEYQIFRLVYVYDPLCGWCFGFHSNLVKLIEEYGHEFAFQSFVGGLIVGDRVATLDISYPAIKESVGVVEKRTSVQFGEGFRTNVLTNMDSYIMDSLPLSKAHILLRAHDPSRQTEIIGALHNYIYRDGKPLDDLAELSGLAEQFGMDKELFLRNMALKNITDVTEKEFETITNWGVRGFPFLFALNGSEAMVICQGYTDYENISAGIENFLKQAKS